MEYRGFKIEKYEGVNVGYAPLIHNKQNHTLRHARKQIKGYRFTDTEGYSRFADTLKETKQRIDQLLD